MKRNILGLLAIIGFVGLLLTTHTSAAAEAVEEVGLSMFIKISPPNPRVDKPVVYEAVLSGKERNKTYQIAWLISDASRIPVMHGQKATNTFINSGRKSVFATLSETGMTNGPVKIMTRSVHFIVLDFWNTNGPVTTPPQDPRLRNFYAR